MERLGKRICGLWVALIVGAAPVSFAASSVKGRAPTKASGGRTSAQLAKKAPAVRAPSKGANTGARRR
jgi:hypothetical protein